MVKVHSIESLATLDGDGIRYAIFFTRCPLRCVYCHNPDTWVENGTDYTAEELLKKIIRYKPYFGENGGVTFSGGEPLLNASFINEISPMLRTNSISYALDTSGGVELTDAIKQSVNNADLVILDLKFWDQDSYHKYTNGDYNKVISFLKYLESINKRTWIRTVIVPTLNDSIQTLDKYIQIVQQYKCVEKYELLGFHTMGFFKYDKMNIKNPLAGYNALDKTELACLQKYVNGELYGKC